MTPLAHQILLETLKPAKERRLNDKAGLTKDLLSYQFFELTAVLPLVVDMLTAEKEKFAKMSDEEFDAIENPACPVASLAFLPAPKTWIEVQLKGGLRRAFLLHQKGDYSAVIAGFAENGGGLPHHLTPVGARLPLHGAALDQDVQLSADVLAKPDWPAFLRTTMRALYVMLAMINTPRSFTRAAHLPHAGLQRRLAAAKGMVGKFPLRGWTEIKLEVRAPKEVTGLLHDVHLTSEKARHFVRAHGRVIGGTIVYVKGVAYKFGGTQVQVKAHNRGNPSLGTKRTRYTVAPPRPGSPPPDFMRR